VVVLTLLSVAVEDRTGTKVVVELNGLEVNEELAEMLAIKGADVKSFSRRAIVGESICAPAAAII
jgi:hypothetical protein